MRNFLFICLLFISSQAYAEGSVWFFQNNADIPPKVYLRANGIARSDKTVGVQCQKETASPCFRLGEFHNACAAVATATGPTHIVFAEGATVSEARSNALALCSKQVDRKCTVDESVCDSWLVAQTDMLNDELASLVRDPTLLVLTACAALFVFAISVGTIFRLRQKNVARRSKPKAPEPHTFEL